MPNPNVFQTSDTCLTVGTSKTKELLVIMEGHAGQKSLVHHLFPIWLIVMMTYQIPCCNQDSSSEAWCLNEKYPRTKEFRSVKVIYNRQDYVKWMFYVRQAIETFFICKVQTVCRSNLDALGLLPCTNCMDFAVMEVGFIFADSESDI